MVNLIQQNRVNLYQEAEKEAALAEQKKAERAEKKKETKAKKQQQRHDNKKPSAAGGDAKKPVPASNTDLRPYRSKNVIHRNDEQKFESNMQNESTDFPRQPVVYVRGAQKRKVYI